uniref:Uncharacterized protein n=1 Tax=Avena sativa TaxID=4498 RepID=A0ACD5YCI0_AVESA
MAERLCNMDGKKAAVPDGEDRLSALPEDVLLLLLSFLPSLDAVQTCVLATRWRNLWKSVPSLRISSVYSPDFVNSLFRYRDRTPLQECVIFVDDRVMGESHRDAEQ